MRLTVRCFCLRSAIVGIGGCADKAVEHGWNCENRENEKETARKASVLSHIAPHIGWHDDPIGLGCRHHGNAAVLGYLDVGMDTRNHYFVWLWSTAEYNCPMIPLRIYRTLIVLFLVSGFLALVEMLGVRIGLPANLNSILSGVVAGGIVFGVVATNLAATMDSTPKTLTIDVTVAGPGPVTQAASIPTLDSWGLLLLTLAMNVLGVAGWRSSSRRR